MRPPAPNPLHVEEIALNAWPGIQTALYDGWVLRVASGYTKRANSATALYPGTLNLATKIEHCERFYEHRRLPPVFRLPNFPETARIDGALAGRGYQLIDTTSVQVLALTTHPPPVNTRTRCLTGQAGLEHWLESFHQLNRHRPDADTHLRLLQLVTGTLCPMILEEGGEVVACGLGVLDGEYFGVFDVVTAVRQRRQGYGRELMAGLLAWGIASSARHAYLQVMISNEPALTLYDKLGFRELYRYWYRVKA